MLSAFLHHTGTETDKFSVIMATNVKQVMDRAVMDRVDESFLFPLPSAKERQEMVKMFMEKHIFAPSKTGNSIDVDADVDEKYLI